jgi:hypothetical protein
VLALLLLVLVLIGLSIGLHGLLNRGGSSGGGGRLLSNVLDGIVVLVFLLPGSGGSFVGTAVFLIEN